MGWWGYGPTEGDGPMDCDWELREILGLEGDEDRDELPELKIENAEQLQKVLDAVALKDTAVCDGDDSIFWHALAIAVMRGGGPLSTVRERVAKAIADDDWSRESVDRANAMVEFGRFVQAYVDGTPADWQGKGLLDSFMEHQAAGRVGLLNK